MDELLVSAYSHTLTDDQRDRLLDKKELYKRVLGYFDTTELKDLENEINKNS